MEKTQNISFLLFDFNLFKISFVSALFLYHEKE